VRLAILCMALAASALVLSAGNSADPDLWGHVRFGQDIIAAGHLPAICSYTYTAAGHPWINQEYLSEVIFAALGAFAGPVGWLILKALLGLGVFALLIAAANRHGVSPLVTTVVVVMTAYNVAPGWNLRPDIFTYTLFAVMIVLLDRGFAARAAADASASRRLWLVPLLFAPWANLHGAFFAGFSVFALYLLCRSVETARRGGAGAARDIGQHGMLLAAAALLMLVNPYGVRIWSWILGVAFEPRAEITEWEPLRVGDLRFIPFILLLGSTAAAWVFTRLRRDATQTVLLAVTAWQSFAHVRHIPFFAILAGLWLPPHLEDLRLRLRGTRPRRHGWIRARGAAAWLTAAVLTAALVLRSRAVWVDTSMYPVAAFEFMASHDLGGKLVVNADWAWYAIAAFSPPTSVSFDYRACYPLAVADMNWDFFLDEESNARRHRGRTPPGDPAEVLRFGEPDLVLLTRRLPHAIEVMDVERARALFTHTPPDWVLLYQDEVAQLWGRRRTYDDPASPAYFPAVQRRITDERQPGFVRWPALPGRHAASRPPHVS